MKDTQKGKTRKEEKRRKGGNPLFILSSTVYKSTDQRVSDVNSAVVRPVLPCFKYAERICLSKICAVSNSTLWFLYLQVRSLINSASPRRRQCCHHTQTGSTMKLEREKVSVRNLHSILFLSDSQTRIQRTLSRLARLVDSWNLATKFWLLGWRA